MSRVSEAHRLISPRGMQRLLETRQSLPIPPHCAKCCSPALTSSSTASASFLEAASNSSTRSMHPPSENVQTGLRRWRNLVHASWLNRTVLVRCPGDPPPSCRYRKIWPRLCISAPGLSFCEHQPESMGRPRLHQGTSITHCLAASSSPAGKCLISAAMKCEANFSATFPTGESVTTPTFLMCL